MATRYLPQVSLFLLPALLPAQENMELGRMWTFENPPLAYLEKEYGFKPDQNWLNSLRLGALRMGGETDGFCSASFVSPKGLIMSNHHCVRDAIGAIQGNEKNWVEEGFYASSLEEEVRLKTERDGWLTVSQLVSTAEITTAINEGVTSTDDEKTIQKKREANKEKVLEEAKKANPEFKAQVVSLYQGAAFQLYQYKVWDDVRLVCTPHLQTAHFGGDPDNFTYPRFSIDFSFCRAYEDGGPADTTKHYFKWKMTGAQAGDLVFIPGNPGTTKRLYTKAQMEYERDFNLPIFKQLLDNRLKFYRTMLERMPALKSQLSNFILGLENGQKLVTGELGGLRNKKLMAQKAKAEAAFKGRINSDPELKQKYGHIWNELEKVAKRRRALEPKSKFQTFGNSNVLKTACNFVKAFDPEEPEKRRKALQEQITNPRSPPTEDVQSIAFFVDHLKRARDWLKEDDPYLAQVFDGKSARSSARWLRRSRLASSRFRKKLLEGGWEAIQESEDVGIVMARKLVPIMRANRKEADELEALEESLGAQIGQALFACYGSKVSPDATMTPRFSDGLVKGYKYNGTIAPCRTTFYGLFGRNLEFNNESPFTLPEIWLERRDQIDLTKSVNLVSTNDIVGGNSGSVMVNKELEVVGLIFDGNIESLPNTYLFKDDRARTVAVHVEGIYEALSKIYEAKRVTEELQGK